MEWWDRFQEICLHCRKALNDCHCQPFINSICFDPLDSTMQTSFLKSIPSFHWKKAMNDCRVQPFFNFNLLWSPWFNNADVFLKIYPIIPLIKNNEWLPLSAFYNFNLFFQWNDGIDFKKDVCIVESRGSQQIKIIKGSQWQSFIPFFNGMMG